MDDRETQRPTRRFPAATIIAAIRQAMPLVRKAGT
jgi:hypothetical protein